MAIGPVEYVIIGFPDNAFNGNIAPALADLISNELVRILDLVFISKDAEGEIVSFEFDQLAELAAFAGLSGESRGMLNDEDIEYAAESLIPGSSAALIVWEDLWATPFAEAVRASNGIILEGGRIPRELVEAAAAELAASA